MTVSRLVERAQQSAKAGRRDAAERAWKKVLDLDARHTEALTALGTYALDRGDVKLALEHLEAARLTAPTDLNVLMALGAARRNAADEDGELEVIRWALAVDPGFVAALLAKGSWHERRGDAADAHATFLRALGNAPPESGWPMQYRNDLLHARAFVDGYGKALREFLYGELSRVSSSVDDEEMGRWREAASICAGRSVPFESRSQRLHVPRLPAIPFFERGHFPFLDELAASTAEIRAELVAAMNSHDERFEPLITLGPGEPLEQWQELNHSSRLTALHLWRNGAAMPDNQALCPRTASLVGALPLCELDDTSPNVFFCRLAPGTQVPRHYGQCNARVTVYLPLMVSGDHVLRVGFEERQLVEGQLIVFDDTLDHETSNSSDAPGVMLVFSLWNPLLDDNDRRMVESLHNAVRRFPAAS